MRVADLLSICTRSLFQKIGGRRNQASLERSRSFRSQTFPDKLVTCCRRVAQLISATLTR
jgi:hypothetical protein